MTAWSFSRRSENAHCNACFFSLDKRLSISHLGIAIMFKVLFFVLLRMHTLGWGTAGSLEFLQRPAFPIKCAAEEIA